MILGGTWPLKSLSMNFFTVKTFMADTCEARCQGCDLIHDLSRSQMWLRISHAVHQINNNICIQSHLSRYCDSLADSLYAALCIGKCTLFLCIAYTRKDNICILSCLCHEKFLKYKEIKTL